jgi:hypothetical protein
VRIFYICLCLEIELTSIFFLLIHWICTKNNSNILGHIPKTNISIYSINIFNLNTFSRIFEYIFVLIRIIIMLRKQREYCFSKIKINFLSKRLNFFNFIYDYTISKSERHNWRLKFLAYGNSFVEFGQKIFRHINIFLKQITLIYSFSNPN